MGKIHENVDGYVAICIRMITSGYDNQNGHIKCAGEECGGHSGKVILFRPRLRYVVLHVVCTMSPFSPSFSSCAPLVEI